MVDRYTDTSPGMKSRILAWLSPLEPQRQHQDIRTHRVEEVGDWLLQTEEYRDWFDGIRGGGSDGSALFCYGSPGVGKTYISSLVVDALCDQAVGGQAAVACFYFGFASQRDQSPAAVLGSVLKQIVSGLDEVPEGIVKAFQVREKISGGGQRLALAEIVELLQDISSSRPTFVCIDALDECPSGNRTKLLNLLNQILQRSPGTRIFLTGRPYIRGEVENCLARKPAIRSITPTKNDIIRFLRAKLRKDTVPDAIDENLEDEIIQNIPHTFWEIFSLAALSIETILQETTIDRRRQKLKAMENGLDLGDVYGAMLGRIKAQGGERARLGMTVLTWISHSKRHLRVDEICHAIAAQLGTDDLDNDGIPAISTLLDCCQGLITIDNRTSTVMPIHPTLNGYLCTLPDITDGAHSKMAEACLTYLNFQHIKDLSGGPPPDPRDTPFLEYSSLYWGTHMRMEFSNRAKGLALQFLDQFKYHISARLLWNSISWEFNTGPADRKPFSALHYISYIGIAEVAAALIQWKRWDVNKRDSAGMTPLTWAARCGHRDVVKLLLYVQNIEPDQEDPNDGRTALSWAAESGHEDVVRLLLGPRLVNPGSIGRQWGKARRVVGQLFGRGYINPDSSSKSGRTPLSWAAGNGHEKIVELLLECEDVNPNSEDRDGRTPLLWATRNGREEVVKLLLRRTDLNLNSSDRGGRTPLMWATRGGHEGVVKLLLRQDNLNPDIPDKGYGETPLSWAAGNGREGVVELLLKRKDVNPNSLSISCRTPLSRAAQNGREGTVRLLLLRQDVNPDIPDMEFGRTPLLWAVRNGREEVVRLLLERQDVNTDIPDKEFGRTPLSWAAENGLEEVVNLLLQRGDVAPDSSSKSGRTPLSWAAGNGHEGIVILLLAQGGVSPDTPDAEFGRTPLSWAAENGHKKVVKILLQRRGVAPDSSSKSGRTPLSWAAGNGHKGIVKFLLKQKDVNPDTPDTEFGRTPLSWAAGSGHEVIVKLLLEQIHVNPDTPDTVFGQTPFSWAARNGHEGIIKLLLDHKDVTPDTPDAVLGQTPLSWAARYGHEGVVKLLLELGDVNPHNSSISGQTPLTLAAENEHYGVIDLLRP